MSAWAGGNLARLAGWQVLVSDPSKLEGIRDRESGITSERIAKIMDAGANVVLTTKGIDDMSLKYFVEAGAIAVRRVPKDDLRCASCTLPCIAHTGLPLLTSWLLPSLLYLVAVDVIVCSV